MSFNLILKYGNTLLVVFNVIGGLLSNRGKVGMFAQSKDSH